MTDQTTQQPQLPPNKIAFVIDGVVQDVLHTDERLAAIFLSDPMIVDVTKWHEDNQGKTMVGAPFDSLGI